MIKPPQIKRKIISAGKTARKSNWERKSTKFRGTWHLQYLQYLAIAGLGLREPKVNARQCESGSSTLLQGHLCACSIAHVCWKTSWRHLATPGFHQLLQFLRPFLGVAWLCIDSNKIGLRRINKSFECLICRSTGWLSAGQHRDIEKFSALYCIPQDQRNIIIDISTNIYCKELDRHDDDLLFAGQHTVTDVNPRPLCLFRFSALENIVVALICIDL